MIAKTFTDNLRLSIQNQPIKIYQGIPPTDANTYSEASRSADILGESLDGMSISVNTTGTIASTTRPTLVPTASGTVTWITVTNATGGVAIFTTGTLINQSAVIINGDNVVTSGVQVSSFIFQFHPTLTKV